MFQRCGFLGVADLQNKCPTVDSHVDTGHHLAYGLCPLQEAILQLPPSVEMLPHIHELACQFAQQATKLPCPAASGQASGGLRQLWAQNKALLRSRLVTLPNLIRVWWLWTQAQQSRRVLRRACKLAKRQKLEERIQEAIQAFHKKDPYRMYKVVRALAPRSPYKQVQLRNRSGLAQDPAEELQEIATFFANLCQGQGWTYSSKPLQNLPFTCEELETALVHTPATKSVAPNTCPGILLKAIASHLAPWLYQVLQHAWHSGAPLQIPSMWKNAWITCVPKRSIRTPRDIRPIALQCPIGKAVLRTIIRKALHYAVPSLQVWPIYAYLPKRSTEHALLRVHRHFRNVRDRCQHLQNTMWTRQAGLVRPKCHGGLTLSLDLSNAFDTVDRHDIERGMTRLSLPVDLQNLLMSWLLQVQYFITHKGHQKSIDVTRGIRQGCVASPFLWLMWTTEFLHCLALARSNAWILEHLSLYADDIISQWDFTCPLQLEKAIADVSLLLDALESMNLSVSHNKSVILLRITGTARKELLKKHLCRRENLTCLKVPRSNGNISYLPVVTSHKYLGTMLSYARPEDQTLQYRLQCGQTSFHRLIKFLGKSHNLPIRMKLRLWTQCILCSYLYGLYAVGVTSQGCTKLHKRIMLDLRRLTGCWSHLTHVSNSELCASLKLLDPIDDLQVRWHKHITQALDQRQTLGIADFLLTTDEHAHWVWLQDQLACWYHHMHAEPNTPVTRWPCPHCPEVFAHRQVMRLHVPKAHPDLDPQATFIPLRDSLNGLPQCRHCLLRLSSNTNLKLHIERKWCRTFDSHAQVPTLHSQDPDVRALLQTRDWMPLLGDESLCNSLKHHCGICQHWCAQTNSLAVHMKKNHGQYYERSQDQRQTIQQMIRQVNKTCTACDQSYSHQHSCPVALQLAILAEWHIEAPPPAGPPESPTSLTTPPSSTTGTKRKSPFDGGYIEAELEPVDVPYDAGRDCRGGLNSCRHCHQSFGDHIGLKRHIERHRCPRFQADRPPQPWILQHQAPVRELMQNLHPEQWLVERDLIQRLRQECALCGRQFTKDEFLHQHLHLDHRDAAEAATTYATHLQQYFHPLGEACYCGTWARHGHHACAVSVQLGILRNLSRDDPAPHYTMVPALLDCWILEGDLDRVWQHPEYAFIFSRYCSLCLNAMSSVGQLWDHLEEFHSDLIPLGLQQLEHVVRTKRTCCPACCALTAQERATAPQCPIFLNCILLAHIRHGPEIHDGGRGRSAERAHGGLFRLDDTEPNYGQSLFGTAQQAAQASRRALFRPRFQSSILMPPDGTTTVETGRRSQFTESRSHVGPLYGKGNTRSTPSDLAGHSDVASSPQEARSDPDPAGHTMSGDVRRDAHPLEPSHAGQEGRLSMEGSSANASYHRGSSTSGTTMGWASEAAGSSDRARETGHRSSPHAGSTQTTMWKREHGAEAPRTPKHQLSHHQVLPWRLQVSL